MLENETYHSETNFQGNRLETEHWQFQLDTFVILLSTFPTVMTFGTVIGNVFVLLAVSISRAHPTKLLIANLALADLLVGRFFF